MCGVYRNTLEATVAGAEWARGRKRCSRWAATEGSQIGRTLYAIVKPLAFTLSKMRSRVLISSYASYYTWSFIDIISYALIQIPRR